MRIRDNRADAVRQISDKLSIEKSFDMIAKHIRCSFGGADLFYVDGFIKDGEMLRIMQAVMAVERPLPPEEMLSRIPYVETSIVRELDAAAVAVLSGQALMVWDGFSGGAILIDARTYPARGTEEPDSDRVMQGAHDGFVETLVVNTALIRRRIRDPRLRMEHFNLGGCSQTDVVICYMDGICDNKLLSEVRKRISSVRPKSLTLGYQSLAETLIRRGWANPFPKIRTTERPDTAAAQVLEGSVLVICDTSPQVMLLPTSIFDYISQTDDYYFPPLTGSYLRIIRTLILILSVVATPLWYLALMNADILPPALSFLVPKSPGALPVLLQLVLVELAIDGLKIASMNTPDMLSNSLSVVGALLLGDFAVEVGWLCPDVIFYMAFVAIAGFAGQNHELGYALKLCRIITLILVSVLNFIGFFVGILVFVLLITTNNTLIGGRYLYPLIPFDFQAMKRLLFRKRKQDFEK